MAKLQQHGWAVGIRFEPMIFEPDYEEKYKELFKLIFSQVEVDKLDSVSLGLFRMPDHFFKNIVKLYPEEPLLASPMQTKDGLSSYREDIEQEMLSNCRKHLLDYIPDSIYYHCAI